MGRIKLALQKSGRLAEKSLELLISCGIDIENHSDKLIANAKNFELDILFLRDDDIPEYVQDKIADIGIVGKNIVTEKKANVKIIKNLGFGRCKLVIAMKEDSQSKSVTDLDGKTIATSHPVILDEYLKSKNISAKIVKLSGSVEIAPSLGVADFICDIVSTGTTLKMNQLKKFITIFDSEAILISSNKIEDSKIKSVILEKLLRRIDSVILAKDSRYIMMNIPKSSLRNIVRTIPSMKSPTVLPLAKKDMLAIHAVVPFEIIWKILDDLKTLGASDILVFPINNMIL